MKKNLFFAALAAVALSAGFTSCSNDDDANADNNKYSELFRVKYNSEGSDVSELEAIYNAYTNAFGGVADSILIKGKDSADCVAQFTKQAAAAENQLKNTTFNNEIVINAWNASGNNVYQAKYGESNYIHSFQYYFDQTSFKHFFMESNDMHPFINGYVSYPELTRETNVFEHMFRSKRPANSGTHFGTSDLNESLGGDYVYLGADIKQDDWNGAITDLLLFQVRVYQPPYEFEYNGHRYNRLGNFSLNSGTEYGETYLYYSVDYKKGEHYCLMNPGFGYVRSVLDDNDNYTNLKDLTINQLDREYRTHSSAGYTTNPFSWYPQYSYKFIPCVMQSSNGIQPVTGDDAYNITWETVKGKKRYTLLLAGFEKVD